MAAPANNSASASNIGCHDYSLFQEKLKLWRLTDDRIVNALNTSVLTNSFREKARPEKACKEFYEELKASHKKRDDMIKVCIREASSKVTHLKELRMKESNGSEQDPTLISNLRKEQKMLKQFQQEINIEEIIQDRSLKAYYERCRLLYTPPNLNSSS